MCACVCKYTKGIYVHVLFSLHGCIHSMPKKTLGRFGKGKGKVFSLFFLQLPALFSCLVGLCCNFAPTFTSVKIITCELLYECAVSAKNKKVFAVGVSS